MQGVHLPRMSGNVVGAEAPAPSFSTIQQMNRVMPIRGVMEFLYAQTKDRTPRPREFMRVVKAVFTEAGALCGGAVCAWCLHAIALSDRLEHQFENGREHPVTGSTARCTCVDFRGMTRVAFTFSPSVFFVTEDQYKAHKVLDRALGKLALPQADKAAADIRNMRQLIDACLIFFSNQYAEYHARVRHAEPERFRRVVVYCARLTALGVSCDLCRVRRVDLRPYADLGGHLWRSSALDSNNYAANPLAPVAEWTVFATELDAMEELRKRILDDGRVGCMDCILALDLGAGSHCVAPK